MCACEHIRSTGRYGPVGYFSCGMPNHSVVAPALHLLSVSSNASTDARSRQCPHADLLDGLCAIMVQEPFKLLIVVRLRQLLQQHSHCGPCIRIKAINEFSDAVGLLHFGYVHASLLSILPSHS